MREKNKRERPDKVGDKKLLGRYALLDGKSVDGNRIHWGSLSTDEFRLRDGWSFVGMLDDADAEQKAKKHSAQKSKEAGREKNYGYALVTAGAIRSITDSNGRPAVRVVATPSKRIPDHISVQRARDYDKKETDRIRRKLAVLLGDVVVPK